MIDTKAILVEVKANMAKLESCPRHDFQRNENKLFSKFRCSVCGGTVDSITVHWYKKGLEHAK